MFLLSLSLVSLSFVQCALVLALSFNEYDLLSYVQMLRKRLEKILVHGRQCESIGRTKFENIQFEIILRGVNH